MSRFVLAACLLAVGPAFAADPVARPTPPTPPAAAAPPGLVRPVMANERTPTMTTAVNDFNNMTVPMVGTGGCFSTHAFRLDAAGAIATLGARSECIRQKSASTAMETTYDPHFAVLIAEGTTCSLTCDAAHPSCLTVKGAAAKSSRITFTEGRLGACNRLAIALPAQLALQPIPPTSRPLIR